MVYEVYLDAVFITNLVMDYILLRLVNLLLRCHATRKRAVLGAIIGALGACLILTVPTDGLIPTTILMHSLFGICMVKIGCNVHTRSMLLQATVALYFTAFLCGGFWDVMSTNEGVTLKTFFLLAGATYGLLLTCERLWSYYKMRTENLYEVRLSYQGKVQRIKGLYDTGNRLKDMGSGQPVSVITWEVLRLFLKEEVIERLQKYNVSHEETDKGEWRDLKPHFLTFQSVGNSKGIALVIELDTMCIFGERDTVVIDCPAFMIPDEGFAMQEDYQVILNAALLEK